MAIEKVINITTTTKGVDKATEQVNKLNSSLKNVQATTGDVTQGMKASGNAILENGGAMGILNELTGGVAMTVKDAVEATKLFNGSLKGLKGALIATGLGAFVVLLGTLVASWDDIKASINGVTKAQDNNLEVTKKLSEEAQKTLNFAKSQDNVLKLQGKSEQEILNIKKLATQETIKALEAQIIAQEEINKAQIKASKRNADILNGILNSLTAPLNVLLTTIDAIGNRLGKNFGLAEMLKKTLSGTTALIFDPEETKEEGEKTLEETRVQLNALKNEEAGYQLALRDLRNAKRKDPDIEKQKKKEFDESVAQGQLELQKATDSAAAEQRLLAEQQKVDDATKTQKALAKIAEEQTETEKEEAEKRKLFAEITEQSKVDIAKNAYALLGALAKKGGAVAKAIAIADVIRGQVSSVSKIISSTAEANAKAAALSPLTAGQPFVTLNTISAGIGIGASVAGAIKAIKDINSESKSAGGGSISGGGGISAPPAPSFNLVEGTGSNQIASGLANTRQPIQAYVVSGAVTTSQQLDRNIVRDASL
jgi:hypothetical protein